ncbi:MAG: diguanylate cyclase domain [Frankiales bacterium]|nr:diguanylate cyclase domain [Frankiales bacterium]
MPSVPAHHPSSFWRGHVRLGAASTAVCSSVGLGYALSSWSGPHRLLIALIGLVALVSCPLIVSRPVMRVLTGDGREPYLYAWSASLLLAVTTTALLDGGGRSPLALLFSASLVFTASGYGRDGAMVMGLATIGCYLLTCLAGSPGTWMIVLTGNALALIAATCALTAGRLRASLDAQAVLTEQLRWQAGHDGLTGCLSHTAFVERVEEEVTRAHRTQRPLGMLMLDLDDFKLANDTFGHVVADELLADIGAALRDAVRGHDVVGRVGGDEFAVVAPDAGEHETLMLADRVSARLLEVGGPMGVGVSVGTAVLHAGDDGRELRQRADRALYAAKRTSQRLPTTIFLD